MVQATVLPQGGVAAPNSSAAPPRRRYPCIFCGMENPDHPGRTCPVRLARETPHLFSQVSEPLLTPGQPATIPVPETEPRSTVPIPFPNYPVSPTFVAPTLTTDQLLMQGGARKLYAVYFPASEKGLCLAAWGTLKQQFGNSVRGKKFEQENLARDWMLDHGDVGPSVAPVYYM